MRILMIGDVVGSSGCEKLRQCLPNLKQTYQPDLVVVNGENSADGNGVLPVSAQHIFDSGADVITGGNHSFRRREIYEEYETNGFLLRPANYPETAPGTGLCIVDKGRFQFGVISLMGQVYLTPTRCPFELADRLIEKAKAAGCKGILVDIHAEATSEKKALAYYLDGKVTAVVGTHTHVQTADARLLPKKTAYITDVGMCGPFESVLGIRPEQSIALIKDCLPVRFTVAEGPCQLDGVVIDADNATGLAQTITAFSV